METSKIAQFIVTLSAVLAISVNGQNQITTPCSGKMIASFTPCINFVTGSSNGRGPSSSCCNSLQSIMGSSSQCACMLVTANVPIPLLSQALSLILPMACNLASTPLQCQATGAPLPPAGRPFLLTPTAAPTFPSAITPAPAAAPAPGPLASK